MGDYLEHIFPFLGVRVIAVNDGYDSKQYEGKTGGMDIAFRNFMYENYSRDLSIKVRSAMHSRMKKGRFVNHVPYGYQKAPGDKHLMVPDPNTAPLSARFSNQSSGAKALSNRKGIEHPRCAYATGL